MIGTKRWTHLAGWCALGALALHGVALVQADFGPWSDGGFDPHQLFLALTPDLPFGQLPLLPAIGGCHEPPPPLLTQPLRRLHASRGPPV